MCVGITDHSHYVHDYHLENVLGDRLQGVSNSTEVLKRYDFLGDDTDLIYRVLSFGYHHRGIKNIHDYKLAHHATLVFRRKAKRKRPEPWEGEPKFQRKAKRKRLESWEENPKFRRKAKRKRLMSWEEKPFLKKVKRKRPESWKEFQKKKKNQGKETRVLRRGAVTKNKKLEDEI